jgi:hypothetical protein
MCQTSCGIGLWPVVPIPFILDLFDPLHFQQQFIYRWNIEISFQQGGEYAK